MEQVFNSRLKQVLFLILLIALATVIINQLSGYLPGLLGAVAFYILSRENYFQLIYKRKWKKGRAAGIFIIYYLLLIGLPLYLAAILLSPKIGAFVSNPSAILNTINSVLTVVQHKIGFTISSESSISNAVNKLATMIPSLFNSTANLLANLAIMLFLLYYLLYAGADIEKLLVRIIPLKDENIKLLAAETKTTIKSNAIGIPLLSIIQGVTAALGYLIFGVKDVALWAFLTGLFSFFPVVGSALIWLPLCIYMYASGNTGMAIGLTLYSVIVTSNIDYFARITIMKKLGDVHPVITMLGIIVGLNLFGFIGLIFGPVLVNYIVVLFHIYMNEFTEDPVVLKEINSDNSEKPGN
jgi:predicted PurR-regulated permease PerM